MVAENQDRANGRTAGEEIARDMVREADETTSLELPDERQRRFRTPGFSRMRTTWRGDDGLMVEAVHATVNRMIDNHFADAFSIMHDLHSLVREQELEGGVLKTDDFGWPVWRRTATGMYVEDWSRITTGQREHFLYLITTRLFEWQQNAAEKWAEAMFAKAIWEQKFSEGYESLEGAKPTIGDREARGKLHSQEDRYFAIFVTYLSRKADAVVRSMELLSQRLKDVHVSNGVR